MAVIIVLIFISLGLAIGFLAIFFWNVRAGQYDDLYTPSARMLFGDKESTTLKKHDPEAD